MHKRIFYLSSLGLLFCGPLLAQTNTVAWATDQLGNSLTMLKASVDKLSAGNIELAQKVGSMKARLTHMQARLQQLADQNNELTKASLRLQEPDPAQARRISELEGEIFSLDGKLEQTAEGIRRDQRELDRASQEEIPLTQRLNELGIDENTIIAPVAVPLPPSNAKEKLRLLKMIDDSKQRQTELYDQLARANVTLEAVSSISAKDRLIREIRVEQDAIDRLSELASAPPPAPQETLDPAQMAKLEEEVKQLQKNYDELEGLVVQMRQKAQKTTMSAAEKREQGKLRDNLEGLRAETKKLDADLSRLRRDMVQLDKRKTKLENASKK
jgi:chromosome segregation ATPase